MCFMCFCVFPQRSQVTPPMCSVCFCVFFLPTFSLILVQTGAATQCVLCVFVFFTTGQRANNLCVLCVFVFFKHKTQTQNTNTKYKHKTQNTNTKHKQKKHKQQTQNTNTKHVTDKRSYRSGNMKSGKVKFRLFPGKN